MNSIIEARNVCMDFAIGDGSIVHALKGINLQIPPNRLSVLRGRSGSGKSTLINILGALDRPTSGEVMFLEDGRDITKLPDKERDRLRRVDMAFVFQSVALISTMTAFENVEFALRLTKLPYKERVERARQSLIQVGLEKRMNHRPGEMSGGEQQRVSIARALAKRPKLLLCDEPTGALDYNTGRQILKLLQETCRKDKMTVVLITHNGAITPMADHIIRMKSGKIVEDIYNENPKNVEEIEW